MEKYIITGQEKELERVLREQRIRVSRGLITITPISECGLVTEEDALKTLDDKLSEKNLKVDELTTSITEKDNEISTLKVSNDEKDKSITELTTERDSMKARIAELEALVSSDNKSLPAADSKELPVGDAKEVAIVDDKIISGEDEKKTGKGKASK